VELINNLTSFVLSIILLLPSVIHAKKLVAGTLFHRDLFWQIDDESFDTIGWNCIDTFFSEEADAKHSIQDLSMFLKKQNLKLLEVKECSAISAAILHDLGYHVLAITQWTFQNEDNIKFYRPGMPDTYKKYMIRSHLMWEPVEMVDLKPPEKLQPNYICKIHFTHCGFSIYSGKDILQSKTNVLQANSGIRIEYIGGDASNINGKRKIYKVFLIVDKSKKRSKIISEIEDSMDKLQLDLSYKSPKLSNFKIDK